MSTYSAKPSEVTRKWYQVDASDVTLGRLSTQIATLLMGKHKPMYTAHIDCGDYVVVTNAKNLKVTADKMQTKKYYRHTGFPGGIKELTLEEKMEKDPTDVIVASVRGMLPANKLRDGRLARLKVYADDEHNHSAQQPEKISLKGDK
jgi:large subunit ribosomal protein L13